mmetsp:Transcript_42349/g.100636  ORF Transcript_42349/g.100636 Transcript_42349/m.100636 type:complete len:301 (+) Transcript_42349:615-1517(+)
MLLFWGPDPVPDQTAGVGRKDCTTKSSDSLLLACAPVTNGSLTAFEPAGDHPAVSRLFPRARNHHTAAAMSRTNSTPPIAPPMAPPPPWPGSRDSPSSCAGGEATFCVAAAGAVRTVASGRPWAARRAERAAGDESAVAREAASSADEASMAQETLSSDARRRVSTTPVISTSATSTSAARAMAVRKETCKAGVNAAAVSGSPTSIVTKFSLVGVAVSTFTAAGAGVVPTTTTPGAGVVATTAGFTVVCTAAGEAVVWAAAARVGVVSAIPAGAAVGSATAPATVVLAAAGGVSGGVVVG